MGCYEDSTVSPSFVFNPGGYKPSSMTPGLCMHACGALDFTYASLKSGNLCLCSNSTANTTERPADMCLSACFGAGNLTCGGESRISVYKSVQVRPLTLTLSASDPSPMTLTAFNLEMNSLLPVDQTVESYVIYAGNGVEYVKYNSTQPMATLAFIYPGNYTIKGKAIVKHSKTGHRSVVESSMTALAMSNVTDIEFFCPAMAPVNVTFSCSLKFSRGANVETTIQFEEGEDWNMSVPGKICYNKNRVDLLIKILMSVNQ